jgi:hypothetical protein
MPQPTTFLFFETTPDIKAQQQQHAEPLPIAALSPKVPHRVQSHVMPLIHRVTLMKDGVLPLKRLIAAEKVSPIKTHPVCQVCSSITKR